VHGGAAAWAMTQSKFWLVGHNAFGPTDNWPVCLLILTKISKIGATKCQIIRLKCTKSAFRWGCVSDPDPLSVFKGPASKGGGKGRGEGKVKGREGERRWREGLGPPKTYGVAPSMEL